MRKKTEDEEKEKHIPTGAAVLDKLLGGGLENGSVTAIYGPGGSGKTNLCLLALARMAGRGKKTIYIDTTANFSVERLHQITKHSVKVLEKVVRVAPSSFDEQDKAIKHLPDMITRNVGMVIIDAISPLYRLEHDEKNARELTKRLVRQLVIMIRCAREHNIPIIITNEVYRDLDTNKTEIVAGRQIKKLCRCIIELETAPRYANIRKHPTIKNQSIRFAITKKGIEEV